MKKILALIICVSAFVANAYSHALEGRWQNDDFLVKIKKFERDPSKLKIVIYPQYENDNACSYVETARILKKDSGPYQSYEIKAHRYSLGSTLPEDIRVSFTMIHHTKVNSIVSIMADQPFVAGGRKMISIHKIPDSTESTNTQYQQSASSSNSVRGKSNTVNQTATSQQNVNGNNNNSTTNVNGNNNQTIIINHYH